VLRFRISLIAVAPRKPDADDRERIRDHGLILDQRVTLIRAITTRIASRAQLTRIADSAIRNGPIF
jgi:hypothetical protein